jgi:hypothetical protein
MLRRLRRQRDAGHNRADLVFPPEEADERWQLVCRFWVPEDTLAERIRMNPRVGFDKWLAPARWKRRLATMSTRASSNRRSWTASTVRRPGPCLDPWNAGKLIGDLQKNGGHRPEKLIEFRQGIYSMGEPSKHFERLVFAGQLDHGGHPVLRWMAGNVAVRFDENLNFMPAKKKVGRKDRRHRRRRHGGRRRDGFERGRVRL